MISELKYRNKFMECELITEIGLAKNFQLNSQKKKNFQLKKSKMLIRGPHIPYGALNR